MTKTVKHDTAAKETIVRFEGYSVTPTGKKPVEIGRFDMVYPLLPDVPEWVLKTSSAHIWITRQTGLRANPALVDKLEGARINATASDKTGRLVIELDPMKAIETATDAELEKLMAAIQKRLNK